MRELNLQASPYAFPARTLTHTHMRHTLACPHTHTRTHTPYTRPMRPLPAPVRQHDPSPRRVLDRKLGLAGLPPAFRRQSTLLHLQG